MRCLTSGYRVVLIASGNFTMPILKRIEARLIWGNVLTDLDIVAEKKKKEELEQEYI